MNYYDYNDNMQLVCGCGWKGTGKEADTIVQDQFLDIRCPRVECDWPLLKVRIPRMKSLYGRQRKARMLTQQI